MSFDIQRDLEYLQIINYENGTYYSRSFSERLTLQPGTAALVTAVLYDYCK